MCITGEQTVNGLVTLERKSPYLPMENIDPRRQSPGKVYSNVFPFNAYKRGISGAATCVSGVKGSTMLPACLGVSNPACRKYKGVQRRGHSYFCRRNVGGHTQRLGPFPDPEAAAFAYDWLVDNSYSTSKRRPATNAQLRLLPHSPPTAALGALLPDPALVAWTSVMGQASAGFMPPTGGEFNQACSWPNSNSLQPVQVWGNANVPALSMSGATDEQYPMTCPTVPNQAAAPESTDIPHSVPSGSTTPTELIPAFGSYDPIVMPDAPMPRRPANDSNTTPVDTCGSNLLDAAPDQPAPQVASSQAAGTTSGLTPVQYPDISQLPSLEDLEEWDIHDLEALLQDPTLDM